MELEKVDLGRSTDAVDVPAAGAHRDSATEQLAQLTLDSMPAWMKAPGGIRRFRLMMAIVVATGAILFGALWLHLDSNF